MFNRPAQGGSGELFPSPAKGHTDEGLSGEQSSNARTLINSALSGYYPRGTVDTLLSGKQPIIGEGSLAQSKVTNLVADLAGKQPAITEGSPAQSKVTNLVADLSSKASSQQLADATATREPTITEGSLAQSKLTNLVADVSSKASSQQLTDAIATREPPSQREA